MKNFKYLYLFIFLFVGIKGYGQTQVNTSVKKVYVIFKTHLDVGFTDLSSVVTDRYITEFIPKAIDVAEELEADGSNDRYVWTTGSWLVWKFLRNAPAKDVKRLEEAIRKGYIVWNAVPYTVESEIMNRDMFGASLRLSQLLDEKYGRHTIAAKMTDVPGHTRGIVAPFYKAGIRFLHVGVNSACSVPDVPPFCRWRDSEGNEIVFPSSQLRKDKGDLQLINAAKVALDKRFEFDTSSAHGLIHVALQAARLGDLDKIKTNLDRFCRRHYVYNSLVTSHDPEYTVYNLDAVLSFPRLFMEMLVYTEPGKIELLPAWPKGYSDGRLTGICVYGGHILDLEWKEGKLVKARMKAGRNEVLKVAYNGRNKEVKLQKGNSYDLTI